MSLSPISCFSGDSPRTTEILKDELDEMETRALARMPLLPFVPPRLDIEAAHRHLRNSPPLSQPSPDRLLNENYDSDTFVVRPDDSDSDSDTELDEPASKRACIDRNEEPYETHLLLGADGELDDEPYAMAQSQARAVLSDEETVATQILSMASAFSNQHGRASEGHLGLIQCTTCTVWARPDDKETFPHNWMSCECPASYCRYGPITYTFLMLLLLLIVWHCLNVV